MYLTRDYAPLEKRLKGYIGYVRAIPKICAQIRANLKTPLPQSFIQYGIAGFGGFASFYPPRRRRRVCQRPGPCRTSRAGGRGRRRRPGDGWTQELARGRARTRDPGLRPGRAACSWRCSGSPSASTCRSSGCSRSAMPTSNAISPALGQACAQYLPHGTPAACVAKMNADKPAGGAVAGARAQLQGLRAFVIEKQRRQLSTRGAGAGGRGTALHARQRRLHQYARAVRAWRRLGVQHRAARPGVECQGACRLRPGQGEPAVHERARGLARSLPAVPALQRAIPPRSTPCGWAMPTRKGWAHYSEEMMWDEGLGDGDPGQHIGQITNALLRDVRYLSAIGLHTRGMSLAESERLFRERALLRSGQCPPAGGARHLRPAVPRLHPRQAHDPQAARGLGGTAAGGGRRTRTPRRTGTPSTMSS